MQWWFVTTTSGAASQAVHRPSLAGIFRYPTAADRSSFVQAVWDQDLPTGISRYYAGLLQMLALLALGGELQVR